DVLGDLHQIALELVEAQGCLRFASRFGCASFVSHFAFPLLVGISRCLPHCGACFPRNLVDRLAGGWRGLARGFPDALAELGGGLAHALADLPHALAELGSGLARALADLPHALAEFG